MTSVQENGCISFFIVLFHTCPLHFTWYVLALSISPWNHLEFLQSSWLLWFTLSFLYLLENLAIAYTSFVLINKWCNHQITVPKGHQDFSPLPWMSILLFLLIARTTLLKCWSVQVNHLHTMWLEWMIPIIPYVYAHLKMKNLIVSLMTVLIFKIILPFGKMKSHLYLLWSCLWYYT